MKQQKNGKQKETKKEKLKVSCCLTCPVSFKVSSKYMWQFIVKFQGRISQEIFVLTEQGCGSQLLRGPGSI